jgi:hypothetical protein
MNLIKTFVFVIEYGTHWWAEREIKGFSEKTARQELWDSLTEEQKDMVESIECVDEF